MTKHVNFMRCRRLVVVVLRCVVVVVVVAVAAAPARGAIEKTRFNHSLMPLPSPLVAVVHESVRVSFETKETYA